MSYYSTYSSRTYRSASFSGDDWRASYDSFRSPRYGYSSYSISGPLGGSAYGRSSYYSGSSNISSRPRYQPGKPKPDYDSTWWKYRHYALDDENDFKAKDEGKSVIKVNWFKDENRKAHHTDQYGVKSLIARRGQEFKVETEIDLAFDKGKDRLQFLFSKGDKPQESKGTLIRIDVHSDKKSADKDNKSNWLGYITAVNGKRVSIVIKPPHDALIGKYSVKIKVFIEDNGETKRYIKDEEDMVYILFNPWCKDDQVYIDSSDLREEYVMNETGRIWMGSARQNYGRPWNFGQFSKHSLEAAIYLLQLNKHLSDQGHGNVTLVCRALSAMTNNNDNDRGVLEGNWSGNYRGGTAPTSWNGSQAILEQYMLTKRPVKYGQCWVYSGVLTTLARTLGIPTRSVTNFESAHDHDYSLTIDNHYYVERCAPEKMIEDSVWNFHVWNESWFQRPDLPDGYDGWQAYDATPQEASEGIMRCGPAPVTAIKEGNVYLNYDSRFIFAEVNGDRVDWVVEGSGDMYISSLDPHSVGKCISTKLPGSREAREDITEHYKHPEGSDAERKAVANASKYSSRSSKLEGMYAQTTNDVLFSYDSEVKPNADVIVKLKAENKSAENRHVSIRLTANAAYYTGTPGDELGSELVELDLEANKSEEKTWTLKATSYLNVIDEDAKVKIYLMARSKETGQVYTKSEIFDIQKPDLELEVSKSTAKVGEMFEVTVKLTNPVDVPLTNGIIRLEGPGIQKNMKIHLHHSVKPGEQHVENVKLTGKYAGMREIIACFNSRQLTDITGSLEVQIV